MKAPDLPVIQSTLNTKFETEGDLKVETIRSFIYFPPLIAIKKLESFEFKFEFSKIIICLDCVML